jgi:MFS family permease
MQINASMLDQSLAIVAPLLTRGLGIAPERIGNLSSLSSLGTVLFLLFGGPILARLGPVRMLQVGALIAVCGLLLATSGVWVLILCAAVMMGVGYGPSPPAGSRILAATAPPQHRTLIFSVKQAGAPVGGALAGLVLAPIAAAWGWEAAIYTAAAVGLVAAATINPGRRQLDEEKRSDQPIGLATIFSRRAVVEPFAALGANRALRAVSSLAFSFAVVQGSLFSFSVTYLVTSRGLSLGDAAFAYACLQGSGAIARVFLGWLADRTGRPALNLTIQAMVAAVLVVAYGSLPAPAPLWLAAFIAGATGFSAASWNGIFMAEIARLSPPDRVAEATSSSTLCAFLGYVSGPSLFSLLVTLTGEYRLPFYVVAGQLFCMALLQFTPMARSSAPSTQNP